MYGAKKKHTQKMCPFEYKHQTPKNLACVFIHFQRDCIRSLWILPCQQGYLHSVATKTNTCVHQNSGQKRLKASRQIPYKGRVPLHVGYHAAKPAPAVRRPTLSTNCSRISYITSGTSVWAFDQDTGRWGRDGCGCWHGCIGCLGGWTAQVLLIS